MERVWILDAGMILYICKLAISIHLCWTSRHFQTSDVVYPLRISRIVSIPCTFSQFLRRDDATPKAPGTG